MRTSARSLAIKVTYVRSLYNNLQSCSYTVLDRNNLLESMISRRQPRKVDSPYDSSYGFTCSHFQLSNFRLYVAHYTLKGS